MTEKNTTHRRGCIQGLLCALGGDGTTGDDAPGASLLVDKEVVQRKYLEDVEKCIRIGAADKDTEVRRAAKRCWDIYRATWPQRASEWVHQGSSASVGRTCLEFGLIRSLPLSARSCCRFSAPLTPITRRNLELPPPGQTSAAYSSQQQAHLSRSTREQHAKFSHPAPALSSRSATRPRSPERTTRRPPSPVKHIRAPSPSKHTYTSQTKTTSTIAASRAPTQSQTHAARVAPPQHSQNSSYAGVRNINVPLQSLASRLPAPGPSANTDVARESNCNAESTATKATVHPAPAPRSVAAHIAMLMAGPIRSADSASIAASRDPFKPAALHTYTVEGAQVPLPADSTAPPHDPAGAPTASTSAEQTLGPPSLPTAYALHQPDVARPQARRVRSALTERAANGQMPPQRAGRVFLPQPTLQHAPEFSQESQRPPSALSTASTGSSAGPTLDTVVNHALAQTEHQLPSRPSSSASHTRSAGRSSPLTEGQMENVKQSHEMTTPSAPPETSQSVKTEDHEPALAAAPTLPSTTAASITAPKPPLFPTVRPATRTAFRPARPTIPSTTAAGPSVPSTAAAGFAARRVPSASIMQQPGTSLLTAEAIGKSNAEARAVAKPGLSQPERRVPATSGQSLTNTNKATSLRDNMANARAAQVSKTSTAADIEKGSTTARSYVPSKGALNASATQRSTANEALRRQPASQSFKSTGKGSGPKQASQMMRSAGGTSKPATQSRSQGSIFSRLTAPTAASAAKTRPHAPHQPSGTSQTISSSSLSSSSRSLSRSTHASDRERLELKSSIGSRKGFTPSSSTSSGSLRSLKTKASGDALREQRQIDERPNPNSVAAPAQPASLLQQIVESPARVLVHEQTVCQQDAAQLEGPGTGSIVKVEKALPSGDEGVGQLEDRTSQVQPQPSQAEEVVKTDSSFSLAVNTLLPPSPEPTIPLHDDSEAETAERAPFEVITASDAYKAVTEASEAQIDETAPQRQTPLPEQDDLNCGSVLDTLQHEDTSPSSPLSTKAELALQPAKESYGQAVPEAVEAPIQQVQPILIGSDATRATDCFRMTMNPTEVEQEEAADQTIIIRDAAEDGAAEPFTATASEEEDAGTILGIYAGGDSVEQTLSSPSASLVALPSAPAPLLVATERPYPQDEQSRDGPSTSMQQEDTLLDFGGDDALLVDEQPNANFMDDTPSTSQSMDAPPHSSYFETGDEELHTALLRLSVTRDLSTTLLPSDALDTPLSATTDSGLASEVDGECSQDEEENALDDDEFTVMISQELSDDELDELESRFEESKLVGILNDEDEGERTEHGDFHALLPSGINGDLEATPISRRREGEQTAFNPSVTTTPRSGRQDVIPSGDRENDSMQILPASLRKLNSHSKVAAAGLATTAPPGAVDECSKTPRRDSQIRTALQETHVNLL